jgi:hypothetical protein
MKSLQASCLMSASLTTGPVVAEELVFDPNEYLRTVESTVPRTAEMFQEGQRAAANINAAQAQQRLYQQQMEIQAQEHAMQIDKLRMQNKILRRRLEQGH